MAYRNHYYLSTDPAELEAPFIAADTDVFTPQTDPTTLHAPFISATTTVLPPSQVADASDARISSVPTEVVLAPVAAARLSSVPVEVVVQNLNPVARFSSIPVEVVLRRTRETVTIHIVE